ncbi:RES family NAD+ phosphorylase [Spirosoma rhododendri]|uniref:RES family NAD+ phosphorylase n=1 Tax=Spirosoma rhododendri TaxID=2728024 RepID=A0A7L5DRE0_9BACT|nr:RES family NAD+ phosphorylase [Spirosoma rhododendri]QJD80021.1 RES family NAD+ phosphorylase [Spirosoma rhododendri]
MLVYRITKAQYADRLTASGGAARWNSRGQFVVYTAASRALACLENVVHRSGEGLNDLFRVMVIEIPDSLTVEMIELDTLPADWDDFQQYGGCQRRGGDWLMLGKSAVLRVPSAIVPGEYNYLLSPAHPDFSQIQLIATEPFRFDPRIKASL